MTEILAVLFVVGLEIALSLDNAVVLAIMVKPLALQDRQKALTYGMLGAFLFRIGALFLMSYLLHNDWMKFIGGGYLLYLGISHFFKKEDDEIKMTSHSFWMTVLYVELLDIIFAIDSITAASALTMNLGVIITGGLIGIMAMRFIALQVSSIIDEYPQLKDTAYYLVALIGAKLFAEGFGIDFHSTDSYYFYGFWATMLIVLAYGLIHKPRGTDESFNRKNSSLH